MIFAIAQRSRAVAFTMLSEAKTQGITLNFDPDVAKGIPCAPFEQNHRIILFETAPPLEQIFIDALEHLCQSTIAQDTFGIFTYSLTPGFTFL